MTSTERQSTPTAASAWWPVAEQLLQLQQQLWSGALTWQRSLLAMQQDLCDQWVSRWADGARLDD